MNTPQSTRTVSPEVSRLHIALISSGDLTLEESMRILFPEDAVAWDLGNNFWGNELPDREDL